MTRDKQQSAEQILLGRRALILHTMYRDRISYDISENQKIALAIYDEMMKDIIALFDHHDQTGHKVD